MTVFGWDASDYDWGRGQMDIASAAGAGVQFFTHKATEGTSTRHVHYGEAMRRARDAGIPVLGAYHVVRSPRNAADEVDFFLNYIDQQFPEWRAWPDYFFQPDLEKWPYDSVPAAEGEDFADIVEVQGHKAAIIYASKGQYGDSLAGTSHELWNANYWLGYQSGTLQDLYNRSGGDDGPGWTAYSGKTPKIWQFTSRAVIGRQNTCDGNAFRGSLDQLKALIGSNGGDNMTPEEIARAVWAHLVGANDIAGDRRQPAGNLLKDCADMINNGASSYDGRVGWMPGALGTLATAAAADEARDKATFVAVQALADVIKAGGGNVDVVAIGARIDAAVAQVRADAAARFDKLAAAAQAEADALSPNVTP